MPYYTNDHSKATYLTSIEHHLIFDTTEEQFLYLYRNATFIYGKFVCNIIQLSKHKIYRIDVSVKQIALHFLLLLPNQTYIVRHT